MVGHHSPGYVSEQEFELLVLKSLPKSGVKIDSNLIKVAELSVTESI